MIHWQHQTFHVALCTAPWLLSGRPFTPAICRGNRERIEGCTWKERDALEFQGGAALVFGNVGALISVGSNLFSQL